MEKPWKVVLAFLSVFVAGAVFGGFFAVGFGSRWAAHNEHDTAADTTTTTATVAPPQQPAAPTKASEWRPLQRLPFAWEPKQLMRRYAERLELTPEQKERLQPVIKRAVDDYRRTQRNTFRETSLIIGRLQEDIAKELTPQQRTKLDEMRERQRELLQRFEERREQRKALQKENAAAAKESHSTEAVTPSASAATQSEKP